MTEIERELWDQILQIPYPQRLYVAAVRYALAGMLVLPVRWDSRQQSKLPLTKWRAGEEGQRATTDIAVIRAWWDRWPWAWPAVALGAGWWVLDVDVKRGGVGQASLADLADEVAPHEQSNSTTWRQINDVTRLGPAGVAVTRSGGWHLWFRNPPNSTLRSRDKFRRNIELKSAGKLVVCAPSEGYIWHVVPNWDDPPQPPVKLVELALKASPRHASTPAKITRVGSGVVHLDHLARRLARAQIGQRNTWLYQAACDLRGYVTLGELSEHTIRGCLGRIGMDLGLEPAAVEATITSGLSRDHQSAARVLQYAPWR